MQLKPGDNIELDVTALGYGRDAVARHDGIVVFVPGAAPGDRIDATVEQVHTGFVRARIGHVVSAGAARVEPPCPVADECGGCPWQHVDYPTQLLAKQQTVTESLRRIGGIDEPPVRAIVASHHVEGYRNRIKLRFDAGKLGFYRAETHSLVHIQDCLISEDRVRANLALVESFIASLATRVTRVEIQSRGTMGGIVIAINSKGRLRRADTFNARQLIADPDNEVSGIVMWGRGWSRTWGDASRRYLVADPDSDKPDQKLELEVAGAGFGQVNTEANTDLVKTAIELSGLTSRDDVLDLYAGAGNFAIPAAKLCRHVTAIEADGDAVEAGRSNAARCRTPNVEFIRSRVETFLERRNRLHPDVILLDPPRSGLGALAATTASLNAPRIVYIACDPTTLARDVKVMCASGYKVETVVPIDLFPHTFHVESVCELRLT